MEILEKAQEFVAEILAKKKDNSDLIHSEKTVYWIKELKPDSDEALLVAGALHDIERAVNGDWKAGSIEEEALRKHQDLSAEEAEKFLAQIGASQEFIERVKHLISAHETGGDEDQNILCDADVLAWLEDKAPRNVRKHKSEGKPKEVMKEKLDQLMSRLSSEKAKEIAKKFYNEAMEELNKMDIKAVVFDADGVVINSPAYFSIQYEKEFGVSNDIIQPFFKGRFRDCVVGKADLKEELSLLLDEWQWKGTAEELMEYWFKSEHYIDERMVGEIKLLKGRGIKCYLGTQQEKYRAEYIKKDMGFEKIFDKIYSSCYIGYEKSDKRFFEYMADDLKLEPREIMFWDNKQSVVDLSKEAGWQGYLYTDFNEFHEIISQI